MSDRHVRLLRAVARQRQHNLERHDALELSDAAASARRRDLQHMATRTRDRVADVQARRRRAL